MLKYNAVILLRKGREREEVGREGGRVMGKEREEE